MHGYDWLCYREGCKNKLKKRFEINMTEGNIWLLLIRFCIPLILSNIFQLLFNAADVIVVGRYVGKEALAAVGSVGAVVNLITGLAMGISVGCNILCSRKFGAGNKVSMQRAVHASVALSIICGIIIMVFGVCFSRQILHLIGTPDDVIDLAATYMRIYFGGIIPILVYNFGASILRAVGDTSRPFIYILISGVINVVLNLIFILVFDMNVAGVALATVISWAVCAVLVIRALILTDDIYKLSLKKIRLYRIESRQILGLGIPTGIQSMVFSLSNVVIQSAINSLGTIVVAGSSAATNIEGFVWMAMDAVAIAIMTFISQNYGAGKHERNSKGLIYSIVLVTGIGAVMGIGVVFIGKPLLSLYTSDEAVIAAGFIRLKIICGTYALGGVMNLIGGAIKGYGKSGVASIIAIAGACIPRLIWVYTVFKMYPRFDVLLYSYDVSWALTAIANIILYVSVHRSLKKDRGCEKTVPIG